MSKVTVVIKTLNEEKSIVRAIESALAAVARYGGEVVVADSVSTDRTVEIAKTFPVTVVQLKDPTERCCGIGPQLGYQHARGDYVYILDGDMDLKEDFLARAIAILDREPDVGGVGGYVHEMLTDNLELQGRLRRSKRLVEQRLSQPQRVECLHGGGLYRSAAIAQVGYLSDRNLHAFEEYDLGARLRMKGWRLVFLEDTAVDHYSYAMSSWTLLWHRTRSGRFISPGELLRAAIGSHYLKLISQEVRVLQLSIGVLLYWLAAIAAASWLPGPAAAAAFLVAAAAVPVLAMAVRQKSFMLGFYSVLSWHFNAVGFLMGLLRARRPPTERIESVVVQAAPIAASVAVARTS